MSEIAVANYLRKAERALDEARLLLREAKAEGACSRAYYAMHDAAHAALIATGHESLNAPIKTHQGLIAAFGKDIVLTGRIDAELGRAFNAAQRVRLQADYSGDSVSLSDAERTVERAEAFLAAVRELTAGLKP